MTPIENAREVRDLMRSCDYPPYSIGGRCVAALDFLIAELETVNPEQAKSNREFAAELENADEL